MDKKVPMTAGGAQALREELNRLKSERPAIVDAIARAREFGDLKENSEYHAAKEHQGFLEGRILDIESKLARAEIIDIDKLPKTGKVRFGSIITLERLDQRAENVASLRYQIVGDDEADLKSGKISVNSPIARAAIGKEEGDEILVKAPSGDMRYEILSVE